MMMLLFCLIVLSVVLSCGLYLYFRDLKVFLVRYLECMCMSVVFLGLLDMMVM